ncbi:MAG: toll/interleukin-1 receptor domain-containing protein [Cyanobacteria bacterium P01_C01_bin.118]
MEVNFPTDIDGFLAQECPSCDLQFKVAFGQGSEDPISHCPYCGYRGSDCWYTKAQADYIQSVVVNTALIPELKKFQRQTKLSSVGPLRVEIKSDSSLPAEPPMEIDNASMKVLHFPCCNETIKVEQREKHFCIICGTEIDMNSNEAKKVFLSHKGVDMEIVREFKQTLELLGYTPWHYEDAIPAGRSIERAIHQGMKDSCGAVFFITPSFKDEDYLELEVDYALREDLKKRDRFAIVALQFMDKDGKEGKIPEPIEHLAWKKPKTQLEALREVIRALPVVPGSVDWRDSIAGVITSPSVKSISTELSDEAKILLTIVRTEKREK